MIKHCEILPNFTTLFCCIFQTYHVDDKVQAEESRLVISNYADAPETFAHEMTLKPYGAYVYSVK